MNRGRKSEIPARTGLGGSHAFTLLELLVVLTIIAILAGLLVPTLPKARARAQGVCCENNLRQMGSAWRMYAEDNADRLVPNNGAPQPADFGATWANGWLTLDGGDNMRYGSGADRPDNTNTLYLSLSLLAPYLGQNLGVWRCPADRSLSTIRGQRYPHVRTVSMNGWLGNYDPRSGQDSPLYEWGPGKIVRKISDMVALAPANTFVLLDERDDSINDSYFATRADWVASGQPAALKIVDFPSNLHNGAGAFNFADGHTELHKWLDPRTQPVHRQDVHLAINVDGTASPNNPDVLWLQQRATR